MNYFCKQHTLQNVHIVHDIGYRITNSKSFPNPDLLEGKSGWIDHFGISLAPISDDGEILLKTNT